jgi:Ca-activated chloride channel family protein
VPADFPWFPAGGRAGRIVRVLLFLAATAGQRLCCQTASGQEGATFSAGVDLVILHPTVQDRKGGFVSGLRKENFQVFEDGSPQAIRVFQHEDVPVAVGLVVDNSGSMGRKRKDVIEAAQAFVRSSNPHDEMFIVNFNERVSAGLPDTELFSASAAELTKALNGVPAMGKTALYDAVDAGLEHLKKATLDKKVLIVISDGGDNASRHTLSQVLEAAGRSDAIVYTVGLFDEYDEDRNPGALKKIARASGGECFLPQETGEVVRICERIAEDIRNQYTIGYVPSNQRFDDSYRTIRVRAAGKHGGRYIVRTRAGYIASKDRQGGAGAAEKLR